MLPLSETLCNRVVNTLDQEIVVLSSNGAVLFANQRAEDTFGQELSGKQLSSLFAKVENGAAARLRRIDSSPSVISISVRADSSSSSISFLIFRMSTGVSGVLR